MKVNDAATRQAGVANTGKTADVNSLGRNSGSGTPGVGSPGDDRVELSTLSERMQASDGNSTERQERLDRLQQAVASGKYRVDEHAVSRAMVDDALRGDLTE